MVAQVTAPVPFPVIGYPAAWSDGTDGPIKAEVVMVPNTVRTAADFAPYRGTLDGEIVVSQPARELNALFTAPAQRLTQQQLNARANPYPVGGGNSNGGNVFVSGGGSRNADAPRATPLVSLTPEHYGRIVRIL